VKFALKRVDPAEYERALSRLQRQCLPMDDPIAPVDGYWWIATAEDGRLAGFCTLHPSQRFTETGYLSRAGVLLHYQGYGLQKRMIRVRERLARRLGWQWLVTETIENPASANSLIACGFRTYAPSQPYSADTAVYWRKRLF
jgi:GNAT superfamily N-acetyltransferase